MLPDEPRPSTSTTTAAPVLRQSTVEAYIQKSKVSGRSKDKIDCALLKMFYNDFQPFSIVEDRGFREFVSELNPGYQLPSRTVISKTLIPAIYEECQNKTKELVARAKTFCLTTDSWSSINVVSYIA